MEELLDANSRANYFEKECKRLSKESHYYRQQLAAAHELLGRVIHQASHRWDSVRLTQYYPTDNLHGARRDSNPTGKKEV